MAKRKYRFKDYTEIPEEEYQPTLELLKAEKWNEAEATLRELLLTVKDLLSFEAQFIMYKLVRKAGKLSQLEEFQVGKKPT